MRIEILYFEGCPTHDAAVSLVEETLDRLDVDAEVHEIDVETDDRAQELGFLGSPSIRVDGVDIDPDAKVDGPYGRSCRVYEGSDGLTGVPPAEWLENAIREAASQT